MIEFDEKPLGPDERLGNYLVILDETRKVTFNGVYPDVICDRHGSVLKICRSGDANKWEERTEIIVALFQNWSRVERIEEK